MKTGSRITMIILSAISMLNVLFAPIYSIHGGLTPKYPETNFFDVIELLVEDVDNWDYWVVQFTVLIFIPTFFMFIFSLIGSKGLCIASSSVGMALVIYKMVDVIAYFEDVDVIFDFDDTFVCIGTWCALILFFVCFIVSCAAQKKTNPMMPMQMGYNGYGYATQYYNPYAQQFVNPQQTATPVQTDGFNDVKPPVDSQQDIKIKQPVVDTKADTQKICCPNCGEALVGTHPFCGKCGAKL